MTEEEQQGQVVVVTGGTYGIGRATTIRLAEAGYRVVAFGLNDAQIGSTSADSISGTRSELKARNFAGDVLEADVSNADAVAAVVAFALDRYGTIDALVNNAAIRPVAGVLETDAETFTRTLEVNLVGMFLASKAVMPHFLAQGKGNIVNIGSGSGWGRSGLLAYCASKGGVFGLSAAMAYDLRPHHIRVNVIVPSGGLTGMTEWDPVAVARQAESGANTVAGRPMVPRDTANAVAFLLSEDADQISGAVLNVGNFYGQGGGNTVRRAAPPSASTSRS